MSWLNHKIAVKWRQGGKRYAADVNEFVRVACWRLERMAVCFI